MTDQGGWLNVAALTDDQLHYALIESPHATLVRLTDGEAVKLVREALFRLSGAALEAPPEPPRLTHEQFISRADDIAAHLALDEGYIEFAERLWVALGVRGEAGPLPPASPALGLLEEARKKYWDLPLGEPRALVRRLSDALEKQLWGRGVVPAPPPDDFTKLRRDLREAYDSARESGLDSHAAFECALDEAIPMVRAVPAPQEGPP